MDAGFYLKQPHPYATPQLQNALTPQKYSD
jgi:hypothetical protein